MSQTVTLPVKTISLEQEINPWEAQAARFDIAAAKLNLDEGLRKVLRYPTREIIVHIPVALDNGKSGSLHRISGAALDRPRTLARAAFATLPTSLWTKSGPWRAG